MESLSIGHRLSIGASRASLATGLPMDEHLLWRLRAASLIDWYIVAWLSAEISVYVVGLQHLPGAVLVVPATYRLLEISQVFGNAVLFEQRRAPERGVLVFMVVSVPRSIAQAVVLLVETILCFGILFFVARGHLTHVTTGVDALDLSFRTMSTVGTQVQASGPLRLLVDVEPVVGVLIAAVVLARLINAMPRFSDIADHRANPSSDEPSSAGSPAGPDAH
jgi:hypothetical protein